MDPVDSSLVVAYLNCHGQTGLDLPKQLQIEEFLRSYKIDILHLQETFIGVNTSSECNFISLSRTTATTISVLLPWSDLILKLRTLSCMSQEESYSLTLVILLLVMCISHLGLMGTAGQAEKISVVTSSPTSLSTPGLME